MKLSEYASFDGVELAELVKRGEISPETLVDVAREAIAQMNPQLNFMACEHDVSAYVCASGAFEAVPFLSKEGCASVAGEPYNVASRLGVGMTAVEDDELVRRFRASGVNILGQATAPEAANSPSTESILHGATVNPWDSNHIVGGSSGGGAAAVACGAVPMAHASDGAGSIRIPASCCGVVGLKPTRARTPGNHAVPMMLATHHIVSRTVRDTAVMLDCISGSSAGDIYYAPIPKRSYRQELTAPASPLRIGFTDVSAFGERAHPDCVAGVEFAAGICEDLGHHVFDVQFTYDWDLVLDAFADLYGMAHPYSVNNMEISTGRMVGPDTRERNNLAMLEHANSLSMKEFMDRQVRLVKLCREVASFFTPIDVLVTPVLMTPPLRVGMLDANAPDLTARLWKERQFTEFAAFTPIFNATGQPAISLPLHQTKEGLPIGIQFASRHGDEATLINLACQIEEAAPWSQRKPEISIF